MGTRNDEAIAMTEVAGLLSYFVIFIAVLSFLVTLSNLSFLNSLEGSRDTSNDPNSNRPVSILVPARNEERNIAQCLRGLVAQNYEPLAILVLDDQSTDRTMEVIQDIAESDLRVRVI